MIVVFLVFTSMGVPCFHCGERALPRWRSLSSCFLSVMALQTVEAALPVVYFAQFHRFMCLSFTSVFPVLCCGCFLFMWVIRSLFASFIYMLAFFCLALSRCRAIAF